ncbi:MAG: hypothetical protein AAB686_03305, partial [Patescibacteria group bacterium]
MNLPNLSHKLSSLLRISPLVGGLEISDSVLRFTRFDGERWQVAALRLPPGLIEEGNIRNHGQVVEALRALRAQILGSSRSPKKINVVLSLSSVSIYSQVFSLPVIEGENLEKAIQLNVQMVSPAESAQTYSGWQRVGEDQQTVRLEILSAFIKKAVVDELA